MKAGLVCWGLAFLLLVSLCTAHQTHGGSTGEHHQSNTEFYSEMDNIVEEYPFQDQPHISPASSEKDKWIASGNLAYYTMLHATKSIYLPVTVRLIFVGFEGDGNQGINLDLANLESWFEHIEHTFHHTWVNLDKNDPNPPKHENQNARVEYTINVEVAKVCPLVTTIIEDAVLQYIRPEDPDFFSPTATTSDERDQNPDFYVDAFSFSYVLGSLVSHLDLGSDAYTLFILNPKSPFVTGDSIYGYRAGFSSQEIYKIYTNGTLKSHIESLPKIKAPVEQKPKASEEGKKPAKPVSPTGKRRSVKFSDFTAESEQWAQSWLARAEGGLAVNPACDINDDSEFCVAEVWESDVIEKVPIAEYATTLATYGTPWQSQYIKTVASQGGYEQCLVDGWVSNERDEKNFNYEEFKRELMKFSLPNQEFTFTVKSIDMSSDPVLAAAFGASLHSVVVPGINVDRGVRAKVAEGTFEAAPQLYIDTTSLQQHLLGIASKEQSTKSSTGYDPEGSTHIPVFLFSMGGYLPVFVDRYYQSVALSNMVVGVQSNFIEWESQMECNAKPVYINLRNPLRSLLASTLQYMAGLVPTHVTYSEAYQTGTQNWLWAGLGNSPLSILSSTGGAASPTVHFSQIQTDNAHRNFVVNSLLKSQHYLNKGVEVLFKQRTTENNLPMHATLALTNLTHYHTEAHAAWLEVATAVASLDWTAALKSADKAIQAADQFYVQARELAERTELAECLHMSPNEQVAPVQSKWNLPAWVLPVTIVFDVIIVLAWFVFRNRKAKLKVN